VPERLAYVVTYGYDAATRGGYMYLPGPADPGYRVNVQSIHHGVEGNWFRSADDWEFHVRALIEDAAAAH
jgi:hypothetical protein